MVNLRATVALLLTLFLPYAHAELSVRLSSDSIEELESVRLVIRAHGTSRAETLDLKELEKNFHIMGNNTSSQYQYINGRTQSWVDYQITLQPKKTGNLPIPPIRIGSLSTVPLTLDVQPLAPSTRQQINELVFYEQKFSSAKVYVQGQISMQRKLFFSNGVQLYGGQPGAPNIPDAKVVTLGENQTTNVQRNGRNYGVVTQNYAIFPEASGALTVPAVEMTASVRILNSGRVSRKGVRVATEEETITVMPVPTSYPRDVPWLPATNVALSQSFEPPLSGAAVNVGDTLTQIVTITVEGNTGASVPPISSVLASDAFREYPQPAQLIDNTQGQNVIGQRIERRNLMPLNPGTLKLPATEIVWWDTEANQVRRSALAATTFETLGTSISPKKITTNSPAVGADSLTDNINNEINRDIESAFDNALPATLSQGLRWSLVIIAILLGVTLAAQGLGKARATHSRALRRSRRILLQQIRRGDTSAIQHSLRQYLQLRYAIPADKAIRAWTAEQPQAERLITLLNHWCYSPTPELHDPKEIVILAEELLRNKSTKSGHQQNREPLPALYPST
ncbi:MAG: hypothetical protein CMP86_07475 [Gammaproteobacteria bacterium]|nr:hypothetical protein [Gammaproteobacteria bacterium]